MKRPPCLAVTQRVENDPHTGERRDALDQRWSDFITQAGFVPLLLPNALATAQALLATYPVSGVLLTGGNSLLSCGGDAPERDALELELLEMAQRQDWPVLGVCRGMQLIQAQQGMALEPVSGHIAPHQRLQIAGKSQDVNSYHTWGTRAEHPDFEIWAQAEDGVIKAIKHQDRPWWGIMWHPERLQPFRSEDLHFFQQVFQP